MIKKNNFTKANMTKETGFLHQQKNDERKIYISKLNIRFIFKNPDV